MTLPPQRPDLARVVREHISETPDFPQAGVLFKDFLPLLQDPAATALVVDDVRERYAGRVDVVVGVEARGFILGGIIAYALGVGFVPVRKAGKLAGPVRSVSYELEYGSATVEMQDGALAPGQRVLVTDDVLATGGTMAACCQLVEQAGAVVTAVEVVLELAFLRGRDRLPGRDVRALLTD